MPMQKHPAPEGGEAFVCLLGGDTDTPNTIAHRRAILAARYHVHPAALAVLAEAAWSGGRFRD